MVFIKRQIEELSKGGWLVFLRKCYTFFLILLAPLGVLVVRLLRPFVVIRFATLISSRIGHFAANTELYLCERDASIQNRKSVDIFYHTLPICNQQLKKMWNRKLRVFNFVRWIDKLNRYIPKGEIHQIPLPSDLDIYNLLVNIPAHLSFTTKEERLGLEAMRNLGIPEGASFICFYARDSSYLNTILPSYDWSYHNYRDSNIYNYLPAVQEVVRRGYFAVRMGAIVKEALKTTDPKIIDYARNGRTDFLDIYLSAKCRFFISSFTGLDAVPRIFRRPIVYTNVIPIGIGLPFCCTPGNLFIPKKLWLRKDHRFLTLSEIIATGAWKFFSSEQYAQLGIEVIENTPEEINAVTIEMDERLKGTWQTTREDEELQQRFWSFFEPNGWNEKILTRIGTGFLRHNQELLR